MATDLAAGWRFPSASRKAHAYAEGETTSLCGRWLYSGPTQASLDAPASPDDCAACRRKVDAGKA